MTTPPPYIQVSSFIWSFYAFIYNLPMDADLFDDILTDNAVKTARAGGNFQPKAKPCGPPRPIKKNSGPSSLPSSEPVRTNDVSESTADECHEKEKPAASVDDRSFGVVNCTSQHLDSSGNGNPIASLGPVMDIFVPDSNEDWHSCFEKTMGENSDIFIGLESLGDFLPDSATVLDNSIPSSEARNVHISDSENTEGGLADPLIPNISSQSEFSTAQDPLAGTDRIVVTSGGCSDDRNLDTEEMETYQVDSLDMSELTTSSGRRKFQPKSKMQAHRQGSGSSIPDLDMVDPVLCQQDLESVPSEVDVVDCRSVPASPTDDILDVSSAGPNQTAPAQLTSEVLLDAEPSNLMGASYQEDGILVDHSEAVLELPGKLASRRAKSGKDESEDEDLEDRDLPAESLSNSVLNEDDNTDEEFQLEDDSQTKKSQKKCKKPTFDKEKPARKRKKDTEASEQAVKAAPKKFSHSTRRRRVDKALLETPEDEIDFQKVPLRDLILLAEYRERMAKKEATTTPGPLSNQSNGNCSARDNEDGAAGTSEQYGEDEAFASEQGREANDEQESPQVEENSGYFNYQTYMDKTPIARWSKQDTELFYEAVRQFGTDLSMIQQLFPGRTRRQIKLKYKKEERQHPLMLREALSTRSKDHSHFELVIERLKQMAAEEKQNSSTADSVNLMGEEEAEEETLETNEMDEEAKSEQIDGGVLGNMEPDISETQSPEKSYDSEEELLRWSQYKSEI
ncbi:uncharacterized protein [Coffea arabica]|uniref:Uncharacterized protein isoform X4 n=1 Tax=Coffea arabica TaxID=13443 RepID=A0ABM4VNA2_COFAR